MASIKRRSRLFLWFSFMVAGVAMFNLYLGSHVLPLKNTPHTTYDSMEAVDRHSVNDPLSALARVPPPRTPTHDACGGGYHGIYHISMGDIGGAAGTIFFQFAIGQLLYAERNNLKPWIHLNNVSNVIYDPDVHGQGPGVQLRAMVGRNATVIRRPNGHIKDVQPGPLDSAASEERTLHFKGTGVWEHYFEPVSDFVPGDQSCESKDYVTMGLWNIHLITPGIHGFSDWAPRCWRYKYLPDYITKPHIPLTEWLEPQRKIAHSVINRYIRFRPSIQQAALRVNPGCSTENPCLGLHIRHSDKAAGRRVVNTTEFLPYAQAFVHSGGKAIYVATDSHTVLEEIQAEWPDYVKSKIRTMGENVVRSHDDTAVFDIGSHHRTNLEIFVEILALSQCQYMIHGLSAVSESSIWINLDLHLRSVNLEDPHRLNPASFGTLVQMEQHGEYEEHFPRPVRTDPWWNAALRQHRERKPTNTACEGYSGVLLISSVAKEASAGRAFFTSVLNQLVYAETHNLKPWVHLRPTADNIYDPKVHGTNKDFSFEMINGMAATAARDPNDPTSILPGKPAQRAQQLAPKMFQVSGTGIWDSYFEPVSDFIPGDSSCKSKPLIELEPQLVDPGLEVHSSGSVRAWRYDNVPEHVWNPSGSSFLSLIGTMRLEAHKIVDKYYQVKPFILQQAIEVNPVSPEEPCLGVHIRNIDKKGKYRKTTPMAPDKYVAYMQAYVRSGGKAIYVASDSRSALQHLLNEHPELAKLIRTQGEFVVRSTKKKRQTAKEWPPHFLDEHHRVNSEALVDVIALSKCRFLVHGFSAISEAAIYFNPSLHKNSVNIETPSGSIEEFEDLVRSSIRGLQNTANETPLQNTANEAPVAEAGVVSSVKIDNATAIVARKRGKESCRNAIVYLAQKVHSSYGRDSFASLLKSLSLLKANYLSLGHHGSNLDLFIFHTGDFDAKDLFTLEQLLRPSLTGSINLVNLAGSPFWARPKHHTTDNPKDWYAWPLFSEGYRRMMHWFAIDIWDFFERWNLESQCEYRYILRLDEDSFIHSPIRYDVFDFMHSGNYSYGYRMCAYEMKVSKRMWTLWSKRRKQAFAPHRQLDLEMCGFYNNFFVADMEFFRSPEVKAFLQFIDRQGHIYRRRLGDLMIHTMAVYAFAPPGHIHRFLDFTYEHSTLNKTDGCLIWGGIQAGFNDSNASAVVGEYYNNFVLRRRCPINASFLGVDDLSPTYSHLSSDQKRTISLHTVTFGAVELPAGRGVLSG